MSYRKRLLAVTQAAKHLERKWLTKAERMSAASQKLIFSI